MIVMVISYINCVLIYIYIERKNDAAITTRVLLLGLIGTITHLMDYTKRELLHTYRSNFIMFVKYYHCNYYC